MLPLPHNFSCNSLFKWPISLIAFLHGNNIPYRALYARTIFYHRTMILLWLIKLETFTPLDKQALTQSHFQLLKIRSKHTLYLGHRNKCFLIYCLDNTHNMCPILTVGNYENYINWLLAIPAITLENRNSTL